MKHFLKHLAGGGVIIAAAVVIGVLHNAVRGQSIPLVQKVAKFETARHGNGSDEPEAALDPTLDPAGEALPEGSVSIDQVVAMRESGTVYIIDARARDAFEEGHIPGAINIPYDRLAEHYEMLTSTVPTDAKVVCYCWSPTCDFSDQLATELAIMGYTDVSVFTGGWDDWLSAGQPVERSGQSN